MTIAKLELTTLDERLAQLTKLRAERKDPDDLALSPNERRAYAAATDALDGRIHAIHTASAALAELGRVEPLTAWLVKLHGTDGNGGWRKTLCDELLTLPARVRDRAEMDRQQDLTFSIKLIDFGFGIAKMGIVTLEPTAIGRLMQAAGYAVSGESLRGPNGWLGSIKEVELRIKDLTKRRAAAQSALDAALITDEERAVQDAEHAAFRQTLATMDIRGGGDGLIAYHTETGAPLPVADMTPKQRAAFEWFDAGQRVAV